MIRILFSFSKGSLKNKLAILSIEATGWQGAKTQEYQDISALSLTQPDEMHRRLKCKVIFERALRLETDA